MIARIDQTKALGDVVRERRRQQAEERWLPGHDDDHVNGELALAAASYACYSINQEFACRLWPSEWPVWFKPKDPRRNLVRAGALILAEIERLDRAAGKGAKR